MDLRIDHVYLVSCKYLSNILFNASPAHVFDALLAGGPGRGRGRVGGGEGGATGGGAAAGGDWYAEVAPATYQRLYETVRDVVREEDAAVPAAKLNGAGAPRPGRGTHAPSLPGLEVAPDHEAFDPAGPAQTLGRRPARPSLSRQWT